MSGTPSRLQRLTCAILLCGALGCAAGQKGAGPEALARMADDKAAAYEHLAQEKFREAADILSPWIDRRTRDPQIYAMTAKAQWKLGLQDDAVKNYEEALRLDYSAAYVHLELAELLAAQGKSGRALTEFDLAVRYAPRDALPHYNYGLALQRMGRKDEALARWRTAYALAPDDATYAEAMGIGLAGVDDASALRYFEKAESLGAGHPRFRSNFGLLLQRLGEYARAERQFQDALAREPGNEAYRRNLALLYMASGGYREAVPLWEGLLGGDPASPVYTIYLARAHQSLQQYDTAIEILERWMGRDEGTTARGGRNARGRPADRRAGPARGAGEGPGLDEAYEILAMSHRGKGDLGQAERFIRKALEIKPESAVYLNNYGVILAEDGRIAEARKLWRTVLEIDPGNATAGRNLSAYER